MQVKFQFAIYDEALDKFELDENVYNYELDDEQIQTYELFKDADLHLYNWFQESEFFLNWIKEDIYPDSIGKKVVVCDINNISLRRFFFFKVTSGDVHYEYFMKLFDIIHENDWQDREEFGEEILKHLKIKKQELIIELKEEVANIEPDEEVLC